MNANEEYALNIFWNRLQQLKFDIIYLSLQFKRCVTISRTIKYLIVGLTTLSSGILIGFYSIKQLAIACSVFIIFLQVFSAVSEYFPFEKRKDEIRELCNELEELYNKMEYDWRILFNDDKSTSEINEYINSYASNITKLEKYYLKDDALPEIKKITQKAEFKTSEYFKNFI